ncbi:AraC family transcriptional regulator [Enterococcus sp. OL5]|uniref:AraC family transcriptional regulator n=1 Tax=Enterococcus sp. OL5 TaxID=2590214 RepID=UPI001673FCD0|nr:AraC family transcriptional regulator [Enterococcus sp. OL5]
MLKEFLDFPFALLKDNLLFYQSQINNNEILKHIPKETYFEEKQNILTKICFQNFFLIYLKFKLYENSYVLIVMVERQKIKEWQNKDWAYFYSKVQSGKEIICSTQTIPKVNTYKSCLGCPENVIKPSEQIVEEVPLDFSDQYQFEKIFLQSLRNGDSIILNKMVKQFSQMRLSKLSECPIQEKKFRIIALITLITRAAINYGGNPTEAYRLSDKHIRKVDQIVSKEEFNLMVSQLLVEFSVLIRSTFVQISTGIIREALLYIYRNVYNDLSNESISNALKVHPAYLSSTFKKKTGTSLRKFITKVKIDEAKHLLVNTDTSFKDISILLNFGNQSYFCKKFKDETGFTPKKFRLLF